MIKKIKSLDLKSNNPCARVGFLPCLPQTQRKNAISYLNRNDQSYLSDMVMTLPVPDQMVTNYYDANKGGNAKAMITAARDEAKKVAQDELCKCSCKCDIIIIHVQLFGQDHLPDVDNPFISNFVTGPTWAPLFSDLKVNCGDDYEK